MLTFDPKQTLAFLIPNQIKQLNILEMFFDWTLRTPFATRFVSATCTLLDSGLSRPDKFSQTLKLLYLRMYVFKHFTKLLTDCLLTIVASSVLVSCLGKRFDDSKRITILSQSQNGM